MDVVTYLPADSQAAEPVQMGERALHYPALGAQAGAVLRAPAAGRALLSVLTEQAQQAGKINADRAAGIETAVQACRTAGPDAPPGVRALLYERLAWAYAVTGNASATERALNTAETALSEGRDDWHSRHLRVLPRVMLQEVRLKIGVTVSTGLEQELSFFPGTELTLMPEDGDHRPDHLCTGREPSRHHRPRQLLGFLTGLRRRRHLKEISHTTSLASSHRALLQSRRSGLIINVTDRKSAGALLSHEPAITEASQGTAVSANP